MNVKQAVLAGMLAAGLGLAGCDVITSSQKGGAVERLFGTTSDGQAVKLFTLKNKSGAELQVINFGAIVLSLKVPDRNGQLADVTLGCDQLSDYESKTPYFGAVVGRYGNRIAKGQFMLEGQTYTLATNNGPNALHGGLKGFDKVVWQAQAVQASDGPAVEFSYLSKDGEEGYPGSLAVKMVYTLTDKNEFKIQYTATTDKPTVVNITHHSYFNLAGAGEGDILGHEMMINADRFTPVDATLIPTGELKPVQGTPMDFTKPMAIGARVNQDDEQLKFGGGYDHNWVINQQQAGELTAAVRVVEPKSGRVLEVLTTEPGVQFYCGNFLDGTLTGKGGKVYKHRYGFCLEPQHFPDTPNHTNFPSCVLQPGQTYTQTTIYRFSTVK